MDTGVPCSGRICGREYAEAGHHRHGHHHRHCDGVLGHNSFRRLVSPAAKAAAGFGKELRHSLFDHIQKLSYTQLDNQGTSTLITRMTSDVNLVQTQVNMAIRFITFVHRLLFLAQ